MSSRSAPINSVVVVYFLFLAAATFAVYSNIFQHEILRWDDTRYLNSELVHSLAWRNLLSIFSEEHLNNWHPLTTLSFAIEHTLWGINAVYSKVFNLFLHLINVLLFYVLSYHLLMLAMTDNSPANQSGLLKIVLNDQQRYAMYSSLFAAAVFSLHPQHVESVVWISERKGLLCAFFYLCTLITYLKARGEQRRLFENLSVVFFLCALMSKPAAISLPIALILLDVYPLKRVQKPFINLRTMTTLLRGKQLYFVLAIASGIITLLYQNAQSTEVLGYLPRLINALTAYLHYLTSIFYPQNLSPFYPFLEVSLKPSIYSLIPALFFFGLVVVVMALYNKGIQFPLIIFAFYVISLLPMIGVVKVGLQSMADRYAYLSTIWIYLLLGAALFFIYLALEKTRFRYVIVFLFLAVCTSLGITTHEHTKHWRADVPLWSRVIDIYPDSASIAYIHLASAHDARGDMHAEQIERLIIKALSISPDSPYSLASAANFYNRLENEQKALGYLLHLVSVAPYNNWAQAQIGDIYFKRNDMATAGNYYLAALKQGSESEEVIYRLALIDYYFKRYSEALAKLELISSATIVEKRNRLYQQIQQAITSAH